MKRILLAATILAAPCLAAGHASAQPIQGLYVGAGGGANFLSDERVRSTNFVFFASPGHPTTRLSFNTGYVALGSVGWGFGNGVRLEAEGSFRRNDQDLGPKPPGAAPARGFEQKIGIMANVLFDLDIGSPYVFPYFGAGAGWQSVNQDTKSNGPSFGPTPFAARLEGAQGHFAYQAIAGAAFPIPGVVGLSATAEYRYLGVNDNRSDTGTVSGIGATGGTFPIQRRITQDNNHSLLVGLRYAFNVVPPAAVVAPVAAPAPAASRSFLVFFDWDKSDLSDRARQIIAQAAQSSASSSVTRIEVDGHADKSGTGAYNQGLSRRRADSVAAELVRDGVPRAAISVMAFGDTRPLVPTAAGVREPQNRRVEIILK